MISIVKSDSFKGTKNPMEFVSLHSWSFVAQLMAANDLYLRGKPSNAVEVWSFPSFFSLSVGHQRGSFLYFKVLVSAATSNFSVKQFILECPFLTEYWKVMKFVLSCSVVLKFQNAHMSLRWRWQIIFYDILLVKI